MPKFFNDCHCFYPHIFWKVNICCNFVQRERRSRYVYRLVLDETKNGSRYVKIKNYQKDMIRMNCTLYEFLKENMRIGISNMEDIHEMMLWNLTCMFHVLMTTVLIQIKSFFKSGKSLKVDAFWQKLIHNYMSYVPNLYEVIIQAPASSDFGLGARILQIGWFYRPKWKIFEKSASKNKHPIKLRFSNWSLQSDNPEKKVIPEKHEFGSYPLHTFSNFWSFSAFKTYHFLSKEVFD